MLAGVGLLFLAKLLVEFAGGGVFVQGGAFVTVPEAHLAGAGVGLVVAWWTRPIRERPVASALA